MTNGDLVTSALIEIRVARAGDVVNPDDMATGLYVYNRLLNLWNADRRKVYASTFTDGPLTANLTPHTIGPAGTFNMTERPVEIEAAALSLGGSPASYMPITVRQAPWYAALSQPGMTTDVPTDVYYKADWPLGKLYFWGIPTSARSVRLWTRVALSAVTQGADFSLPQGYQAAIELTLAEELAPMFGQAVSESTARRAREARAVVFGNNDDTPRLVTCDAGLARADSGVGFNWVNRSSV